MAFADDSPVRRARRAAGLTHADLATRAGVSRQTIGAIEAGRHRPSVDAALGLAAALGVSVEALFSAPSSALAPVPSEPVLADTPQGTPLRLARVGERVVHAPTPRPGTSESWSTADGVWGDGAQPFDPRAPEGFVVVGCDPALGLLAEHLTSHRAARTLAVHGSTRSALDALAGGRAHAALIHGRDDALPPAPGGVLRLQVARWQVGLASTTSGRSLSALVQGGVVQREAGASSQRALLRAVEEAGLERPSGPVEAGHLSVARRVADGAATGVTMEPAAVSAGLRFYSLEAHTVELWVARDHADHPGFAALGTLLTSSVVRRQLRAIGGYDLARSGTLI